MVVFLSAPLRLSANWVAVGPAPAINAQCEGITSAEGDNPVAGAINAVAPSATDANLIYVAAVNGGVWRTTNAKAASPNWTPLTDQALPSLSVSAIAISPLDPQVIFVGAGRVSSLGSTGGREFGVGRSTNGGATWTVVGPNLADRTIRSVVPTRTLENGNQVVLVGSTSGIFRSVDGGITYALVTNGIPGDNITDLVGDPGVPTRFYAASSGTVYRSDDTGATWVVANGNGFVVVPGSRVLLSVHNSQGNNVVYAAVLDAGALANVYRSPDQGANWTALGVPTPTIYPGRQGEIHGAIVADKTDPNTVWISGDRQPDCTEIGCGPNRFPNPNGANNYTGNIWRNAAGTWQLMTNNGANGSSPHADSRAMAFDADGNILHTCDGGIYKLNDPNLATRRWSSLNSDIKVTEAHSMTYDPISKNFMCGTQDNGVSFQRTAGNFVWNQATQGDGGRVGVDTDQTAHAGTSFRYFSSQNFGGFSRGTYDAMGVEMGNAVGPGLMITAGAGTGMTLKQFDMMGLQFIQPFTLNSINPARMLIGTGNIYESLDRGETLTNLGTAGARVGNGSSTGSSPIAYGSQLNGAAVPEVFYVGAGNRIIHRGAAGGATTTLTYPGDIVRGIVVDPRDYKRVFVLDSVNKVYGSVDAGGTWTDLTGNLATLTNDVRGIELFNRNAGFQRAILYVCGAGGVWQLPNPTAAGTWTPVSAGLPNVLVYGLRYDYADNVLAAGTLGRGVFTLSAAPPPPTNLVNIATRMSVQTGDNRLIAGFIVTGTAPKRVIVRALGPSLSVGGNPIPGRLGDTTLQLVGPSGPIATNDNWRTTQEAEIIASTVPPPNDLESAIVATLPANNSAYTAIVEGAGMTSGIGSVEVYDLDQAANSQLANISTRGLVQAGDNVMIGGIIVVGPGTRRVIVRALGPSLNVGGVPIPGRLPDSTLEIANANGMILFMNDDWRSTQEAEIIATTVPPPDNLESAIVATLPAAPYTAIVRGKNGATGIGQVEVYALN